VTNRKTLIDQLASRYYIHLYSPNGKTTKQKKKKTEKYTKKEDTSY